MAEGGPCVRASRIPASAIRDVDAVHGIVVKQSQKRVDHSHHVANNLLTLLRGGTNSDVTFVVGGKVFNAHRIILAAQCEYFRLLLFGNMVEATPGVEIEVKDASPESFHFLLEYLYCGRLDLASLNEHTVLELLALADKYNLVDLLKSICVYLGGIVNITNVCQILTYADMHQLEKLQKKCLTFIDNNAIDIMKSETFCSLPESLLVTILQRDSFFANEMSIFKGCVKWAEHNQKYSSDEMAGILQVIRLYRLSLDEIFNIVPAQNVICCRMNCWRQSRSNIKVVIVRSKSEACSHLITIWPLLSWEHRWWRELVPHMPSTETENVTLFTVLIIMKALQ